ncbi:MAG: site-specific integrase [Alphaproteobacteria bacterium]|nr:site-specific integrase [Alphaproteobacteria bacterium]
MMHRLPSYLYLRNGIYYFQLRIPKHIKIAKKLESTHIRRSTKTRDKVKALGIARRWWVDIMKNSKNSGLLPYEEEGHYNDELYSRGRFLKQGLDACDPNDSNEVDQFIYNNFGRSSFSEEEDRDALYYYQVKRDQYEEEQKALQAPDKASPIVAAVVQSKRLEELINRYIDVSSNGKTNSKTLNKYRAHLMLFLDMVGNKFISDLTYDDIIDDFINRLPLLPVNMNNNKKFLDKSGKRLSVDELISLAKDEELSCLSLNTQYDKRSKVKAFLTWCKKLKYIDESLLTAFDYFGKPEQGEDSERDPFTPQEIEKIFYNDTFQTSIYFRNLTFRYWGPLISYYTGARLGEVSQIHLDDIKYSKEGKCWFVDLVVSEKQNRRLKTKSSIRTVPIHDDLRKLGLLDYKRYLEDLGKDKLFPSFEPDQHGTWGRPLGRWFNAEFLKECGVKFLPEHKNRKVFHSFRNTILNESKQQLLNERVIQEVVGHAHQNGTTKKYQKVYPVETKYKELKKLKFHLDINKLKKWE